MTITRRLALATSATIAAALLAACDPAASTPTATAPTTTTAATPTSADTPTAAPAATGAQAVSDWYANGGQASIDKISATMGKFSADSTSVTKIGTDCQELVSDVTAAQAADPIPDKQAQASWSSALTHYHEGASDCAAGANSSDADQVAKGTTEISEGTTDLVAAAARINELAGQ